MAPLLKGGLRRAPLRPAREAAPAAADFLGAPPGKPSFSPDEDRSKSEIGDPACEERLRPAGRDCAAPRRPALPGDAAPGRRAAFVIWQWKLSLRRALLALGSTVARPATMGQFQSYEARRLPREAAHRFVGRPDGLSGRVFRLTSELKDEVETMSPFKANHSSESLPGNRLLSNARALALKRACTAFLWSSVVALGLLGFGPEAAGQCATCTPDANTMCVSFEDQVFGSGLHNDHPSRWLKLPVQQDFALWGPKFDASGFFGPYDRYIWAKDQWGRDFFGDCESESGVVIHHLEGPSASTVEGEMANYLFANYPDYSQVQPIEDLSTSIKVLGGAFDQMILPLRAKGTIVGKTSVSSDGFSRTTDQCLVVVLDWGIGASDDDFLNIFQVPLTMTKRVHHFVVINIWVEVYTGSPFPASLSFDAAERQTLGGKTAAQFSKEVLTFYLDQLALWEPAPLMGAVPQWLFLYDFSAVSTSDPTNVPCVNQYDAGGFFDLPVRFRHRGGAACGPSSLMMALEVLQFLYPVATDVGTLYTQTIKKGDPAADVPGEIEQNFDWKGANGATNWLTRHGFNPRYRDNDTWEEIEDQLAGGRPVLLRTLLSQGAYPHKGGGHVILLLGIGQNQDIKNALAQTDLGGNGDYYIVADPAGHYFANPKNGGWGQGHNGPVSGLATNTCAGIYLGGWFAAHPKSALRDFTAPGVLKILTPLASHSHAVANVHSPVTVLLTDPGGRRTGILPDGTVLQEIAQSEYQIDEAVEQESGNITIYPDGPKSVAVDYPAPGVYRVDLVGTGTGPFTLDWLLSGEDGSLADQQTRTGNVTPGSQTNFFFTVPTPTPKAPRITVQPQSQTVAAGTNVTFTVSATGTPPLSYQWQFYSTNLPGGTGSTLILNSVATNRAGPYQVIVSNAVGSVTSVVATLTVTIPGSSFTISVAASPASGGTVTGGGTFLAGTSQTVIATANPGFMFSSWTENGIVLSTSPSYGFVVIGNRSLVANFTAPPGLYFQSFDIGTDIVWDNNGQIIPWMTPGVSSTAPVGTNGYDVVSAGLDIWGTAEGFRFVYTNLAGDFDIRVRVASMTKVENWTKGGLIAHEGTNWGAHFFDVFTTPPDGMNVCGVDCRTVPNTFAVALDNSGPPFAGTSFPNMWLRLQRTGNTFQGFRSADRANWTLMATTNINMAASLNAGLATTAHDYAGLGRVTTVRYRDIQVIAAQPPTCTVAVNASPAGGGTATGGGSYAAGSSVTATATPGACYRFVNWTESGTVVSTSPSYTFTAAANRTLVANFSLITYTISASSSPVAAGTISGAGTVNCGQSVTLTATPAQGYEFANWTEAGNMVSTSPSYTFTANGNRTLVANFAPLQGTLTVVASPPNGGSVAGSGTYPVGSQQQISATPSSLLKNSQKV